MHPGISNEAVETSFLRTGLASISFPRMVDVMYTDFAGNTLPMLVLTNRIGLGVAQLWSGKILCIG